MLLELVGPELQSLYDDRQIEVLNTLTFMNFISVLKFMLTFHFIF